MNDETESPPEGAGMMDVVNDLESAAKGDEVSLGAVLEELEHAGFVPVLLAPALAVVTPLSGIPLFSSVCGITITLVAVQMLFGRTSLWLPAWLRRRKIPSKRLETAAQALRKPARWIDGHARPRLQVLVTPPLDRVIFLLCTLAGLVMPALEFIPFSSSIMGAAVALLSLTLLLRDGLFALFGYGAIVIAVAVVVRAI
jgi:hypothetical protein